MGLFDEVYRRSLDEPEAFWAEAAGAIDWVEPWERVLDDSRAPFFRWFTGGKLNTAYNALDRHVERGRADQLALLRLSGDGTVATFTYRELRDAVARFAGALASLGVGRGDRVVVYMPMVPEAVVAMLACARLGAVHSVVFGGFAAHELASRIEDAEPRVVVTASCGIEPGRVVAYKPLLDAAIDLVERKPEHCVVLQRPMLEAEMTPGRDVDWEAASPRRRRPTASPVEATDPLYVIYTSGTTGQPKGIVRDNGGHAVALAWTMKHVYDIEPGEVYWAASDVGWVVGHSYIVYAPLLHGCTTVLYEGKPVGTPDAGAFWRVIADHGVCTLFTAPTAFRAIRQQDPEGQHIGRYDLSRFRALFLAGERCDPDTLAWAEEHAPRARHRPLVADRDRVADRCELPRDRAPPGRSGLADPSRARLGHPRAGRRRRRATGRRDRRARGQAADAAGLHADALERRRSASARPTSRPTTASTRPPMRATSTSRATSSSCREPTTSSTSRGTGSRPARWRRCSHRTRTWPSVPSSASRTRSKGQLPVGFLVLKAGVERTDDEIAAEAVQLVRERIGPVAAFKTAVVVERLPKTRSGKILRGTMRRVADGDEYATPATIDDPAILDEIGDALATVGYARSGAAQV